MTILQNMTSLSFYQFNEFITQFRPIFVLVMVSYSIRRPLTFPYDNRQG